ncbi:MAG: hypothetical protein U0175_02490 [Caldilineaceae bacterium]
MNWTIGWRQNIIYRSSTLLLALLLNSCASIGSNSRPTSALNMLTQPSSPIGGEGRIMGSQATYAPVSFGEISDQATAIFVGKVTAISPAQWNQDSGEYWCNDKDAENMSCFVFSYLEIDVLEPIVDDMGLEAQVKVLAPSQSYVVDEKGNVIEERTPPT